MNNKTEQNIQNKLNVNVKCAQRCPNWLVAGQSQIKIIMCFLIPIDKMEEVDFIQWWKKYRKEAP